MVSVKVTSTRMVLGPGDPASVSDDGRLPDVIRADGDDTTENDTGGAPLPDVAVSCWDMIVAALETCTEGVALGFCPIEAADGQTKPGGIGVDMFMGYDLSWTGQECQ